MNIKISGRQVDLGDALRAHVEERMGEIAGKYFTDALDCQVVFSREGSGFRCDSTIHIGHGIEAVARGEAQDIYASFDAGGARLEKQLRRFKRRLRDHRDRADAAAPAAAALNVVLQAEPEQEEAPEQFSPITIAENTTEIFEMSVGDAVMKLELGGSDVVVFKNSQTGRLALVHRRSDGHIGWMDLPPNAEADA